MRQRSFYSVLAILALILSSATLVRAETWSSFLTPQALHERLASDPKLVVVDVRSADKYAAGHIPGAINLPGEEWRTREAKPGHGQSQYIFRTEAGTPDIARYEQFLGNAGLTRDQHVVIYGNHAGKADGSVPAMILAWLGQEQVAFLDGVGADQWKAAGYELTQEPKALQPATYVAQPQEGFVWNLSDVVSHLGNPDVLFYDTRAPKEYNGTDLRDNKRGGHIPGAVLCNYEEFLTKDSRTVIPVDQVKKILEERKITPDKQIVLYCQTATRVSLPYLALRDLGYKNVSIYDASWFEYGNRDDTPIELPGQANTPAQPAAN